MLRLLHDGLYAMIVEQTPSTRTVIVNKKKYNLPFPYMVFALSTQKNKENDTGCHFYALGSTKPVKSRDDHVFCLPLPNTYNTGVICLNHVITTPEFTNADECEWHLRKYINLFWNSPYETGGVSTGDKRWESTKHYWISKDFNPHNIKHWNLGGGINPAPLSEFFHKAQLQEPLDPRFTDETIGDLAAKVKDLQYWRSDEECWLLAEQGIARNLSCH
jgi:hypothetical protein